MCKASGRFEVRQVVFWQRPGMYAVFGVPASCDGAGRTRHGVCLVCQSDRDTFAGYTLAEDGRVIGAFTGPWRNVVWLMGACTLAEAWKQAMRLNKRTCDGSCDSSPNGVSYDSGK